MIEDADLDLFERSVARATERYSGGVLDAALEELGWADALAMDPRTAVSVLFPLQGLANDVSGALGYVVRTGLGLDQAVTGLVVIPKLGSCAAPARRVVDDLEVRGLAIGPVDSVPAVLVAVDGGGLASVDVSELDLAPVAGIDPTYGLVEVTGAVTRFELVEVEGLRSWPSAVALAQLAVAHELVGAARGMLEMARKHALDRVQFGQTISHFQAVRHRLADALVAIEAADAVLASAWDELSTTSGTVVLAGAAKALAGRGAQTAARHCQQVLAGVGFTAEHRFHLYFRRVMILDQLFGSSRSLTEDLGRDLLASRHMPQPILL